MMQLPGVLATIAEVASVEAALELAKVRGGTQVYFPAVPANDHWLCRLIGRPEARAVCERLCQGFAGMRVDIPLGPTGRAARGRDQVDTMLREGRSERDIALATGYTARAIRRRRAALAIVKQDRQLSLF
ncbi:hypothetical protein [Sphingomonas sp. VNH70]|uniref:hypothetical protein n=1 Tax=Sphingomonas silueang TaxID=3156617 RepID=UPI0032B32BB2